MQYAQCTPYGRTRIAGRMAQDQCHFISRAETHHISQRCVHGVHSWPVRANQQRPARDQPFSFIPPALPQCDLLPRSPECQVDRPRTISARWQYRRAHVPQRTCETGGWVQLGETPSTPQVLRATTPAPAMPGLRIFCVSQFLVAVAGSRIMSRAAQEGGSCAKHPGTTVWARV